MQDSNVSERDMLNYAVQNGIIDLSYVQDMIKMKRREEVLEKHPYSIYQGKDKKWYTHIPDLDRKEKRKLIKRSNKEEIEQAIIDYWKEKEENPTVKEVFNEWLDKRLKREEISKSTFDRYKQQYTQCFEDFGAKRIKSIEEYEIEEFVLNIIHEKELTAKGFGNLRTLIFGIFKYAKKKKYVSFSITDVMGDIEIPRKAFRKTKKKTEELVFNENEMPRVIAYLEEDLNIVNLAILLLFKTGMRIGELVALKPEDIYGNVIHINRTEIRYKDESGQYVYEVRDFPKSEAGIRDVVVPESGLWILKRIQMLNPFGEYVFMRDGERLRAYNIRMPLRTICKNVGIIQKSPNKIRKTYGSILIDGGVDESLVISQMGHTDIKTTKGHYYKDRKSEQHKAEIINKIAGL